MVGDPQEKTKKEARTQAGLRRAGKWRSTPVGEDGKGRMPQEGQPPTRPIQDFCCWIGLYFSGVQSTKPGRNRLGRDKRISTLGGHG